MMSAAPVSARSNRALAVFWAAVLVATTVGAAGLQWMAAPHESPSRIVDRGMGAR